MPKYEWKYQLELPLCEAISDVLWTFLRTSEFGEWQIDPTKQPDEFHGYFCRGRAPIISTLGLFRRENDGGNWCNAEPAEVNLYLRTIARPSPARVVIKTVFHFWGFWTLRGDEEVRHTEREEAASRLALYIHEEVKALAEYFCEFYQLPDVPEVR